MKLMKLKAGLLAAGLAVSCSALAEDCLPGFGPGCVTPGVPTTPERVPIPGYLPSIWIGGDQYVQPACSVVANEFALCLAALPGGYFVGGLSPSCPPANATCPNLVWLALAELRLSIDAALRAASALP
jgi:hypothetical protein